MTVEYPSLKGKVIKQIRFAKEEEAFTALILEFNDNTHVSFLLKPTITFAMEPEISRLKNGNIVNWRKLKPQVIRATTRPEMIGVSRRRK